MKKRIVVSVLILVCLVSLSFVGLVACGDKTNKLTAPVVTLNGDVASWGEVPNAIGYEISLGGSLLKVEATVTSRKLVDGATIKVRAMGDGDSFENSDWSNVVTYSINNSVSMNINFVMINDTHGALTDSSDAISIGRVDSLIQSLKQEKGDQIFIHNGDAFQGSYVSGETYGRSLLDALNAMELDCFVLGNHEFDWGIDKIAAYRDGDTTNGEANFPFLGANIFYKGTQTRPDWIDSYHIVEQDGAKVGIIGIMGPEHESSILTRYVKDYDFVAPLGIVSETASYLRNTEKCDVVVVAMHEYDTGLTNSIGRLTGDSIIDAIFCAHTHRNIYETITRRDKKEIPVVQCYDKNGNMAEVVLNLDANKNYLTHTATKHRPENYSISTRVQAVIDEYQYLIDESNETLGYVNYGLSEDTLGTYATEAILGHEYALNVYGDIDVSIINTGGVRADINGGDITKAEVFEVFPFNNMVVIVNMLGADLKELCEENEKYFYIGCDSAIGSYSNIDDNNYYQLAVIDYVFEGTRYEQFKGLDPDDYVQTDVLLRDLLLDYLDEKFN